MDFWIVLGALAIGSWLYINKSNKNGTNSTFRDLFSVYLIRKWKAKRKDKQIEIVDSVEDLKVIDRADKFDSQSLWLTNSQGMSVHISMKRKYGRIAEVSLILIMPDGSIYRLPRMPNTIVFDSSSQAWSAGDLKMFMLEPFRTWRILFNGLLTKNDDAEPIHVKINLIWTPATDPFTIPDDTINKLTMDYLTNSSDDEGSTFPIEGFDQYGMAIGVLVFNETDEPIELNLHGLKKRRWGLEQRSFFDEAITYNGMTTDGTFYSIEMHRNKRNSSCYRFGSIRLPNCTSAAIDGINFQEPVSLKFQNLPKAFTIKFTANKKHYTSVVHLSDTTNILRGGNPWDWEKKIQFASVGINGHQGFGVVESWYHYDEQTERMVHPVDQILAWTDPQKSSLDSLCVSFESDDCRCPQLVGAKGASLALLMSVKNDDYQVPNGFCLTVNALNEQLAANPSLADAIDDIVKINAEYNEEQLKKACDMASNLFANTKICDKVKADVKKYFTQLSESELNWNTYYAVRSSGIGEDSEELSAAGQNATILGCKRINDIYDAVQRCWASFFTYQSVEYRRQHGQIVNCGMGVVVQTMIDAYAAGVMFTRHPMTGDPSCILITSNYGLGETVVSGQVDPDTIYIKRDLKNNLSIKNITIGKKSHKMSLNTSNENLYERTSLTSVDDSNLSSLSDKECLKLGKIAVNQEYLWGAPRDIEWAISKGIVYLVQARPITSLQSWYEVELLHEMDSAIMSDDDISTFANTGEVLPEPMSPLTRTTMCRLLDKSTGDQNHIPMTFYTLTTVSATHHRIGLNVANTMLRSTEKEITMSNKVIDVAVYGHVVYDERLRSIGEHRHGISTGYRKFKDFALMAWFLYNNKRFGKEAMDFTDDFEIDLSHCKSALEIYEVIQENLKHLYHISMLHGQTSSASLFSQIIFFSILLENRSEFTLENYTDIANVLTACTDIISGDVPKSIANIARSLSADKIEEFRKQKPEDCLAWLEDNSPSTYELLQQFLKKHGHRGYKEFDFTTDTWGLDPTEVIKTIQATLLAPIVDKPKLSSDLVSALVTPVSGITKSILKFIIPICQKAVACREDTKSALIFLVHKFRLAYRTLGQQMMKEWLLPELKLVFYMTEYELGQYLKTRDPGFLNKAVLRRRYFPRWTKLRYPEMNFGFPKPLQENSFTFDTNGGDVQVIGTPVCSGKVVARACVVQNISEIGVLQNGDILIAHSTDIGWSPYFPMLGGVVTELGGLISHGAVVAREYGLPCIVGAHLATSVFKTGDMVLLDSTKGILLKVTNV